MSRSGLTGAMTAEHLEVMPDTGYRHELQSGLLLSEPLPGFRHGHVTLNLASLLRDHARRSGLAVILVVETGFILSRSPDTVRGPDVAVVTRERAERVGDLRRLFPGAPDLAVEVLSPSNSPAEIHAKVADYLAAGTKLVWVVDSESKSVAVYRALLSPETLASTDRLTGDEVLPGLAIDVAELFED
jgi:Uma2 family endonuclease